MLLLLLPEPDQSVSEALQSALILPLRVSHRVPTCVAQLKCTQMKSAQSGKLKPKSMSGRLKPMLMSKRSSKLGNPANETEPLLLTT